MPECCAHLGGVGGRPRKVDVRLPGKGNSNSHGTRPVHLIITMIKWIRTSGLSIKNSLSGWRPHACVLLVQCAHWRDFRGFSRNVKRFRGGLVHKAHRLLCHSTLGLRVVKKKKCDHCGSRCRASMTNVSQSRPEPAIGLQVEVLKPFQVVPFSLGSLLCDYQRLVWLSTCGVTVNLWRDCQLVV